MEAENQPRTAGEGLLCIYPILAREVVNEVLAQH
jgi:hypothetical protein